MRTNDLLLNDFINEMQNKNLLDKNFNFDFLIEEYQKFKNEMDYYYFDNCLLARFNYIQNTFCYDIGTNRDFFNFSLNANKRG